MNHIDVTQDRDPLDLCNRLLHNASNLVTLLIRRPVIINRQHSNTSSNGQSLPSRIKQMPVHDGQLKRSTIERFQLVRITQALCIVNKVHKHALCIN